VDKGLTVRYRVVDSVKIHHCGLPEDYSLKRDHYLILDKEIST
jgi:hypothetical protein